jgi:TRAP transporter 4TM/12TM fusion protein
MVAVILLSLFSKKHRITLKRGFNGMEETARDSLPIAITCAAAGVIIGIILMTGLGNKLSEFVLFISGGRLFLILFFTMVASLILGMGLPTTVCYILLAVTVAPTIVQMGVPPLAAHLFIFYFGLLCMVTPPVAMAAYAAAGIARTDPMRTGYIAWWFSLSGYILPYIWVYNPSLILMGSTWEIIQASITATVGVVILGAGISGYFRKEASWWERMVLMVAAVLLIKPGMISDIIGFVLAGGIFVYQEMTMRNLRFPNSKRE